MFKESTYIRFLNKVNKTKDCWLWLGSKNKKGYGHIRFNKKTFYAHRLSYLLYVGKIPINKFVCHDCDNPSCVNPKHLFCGTNSDNLQDASKKGRLRGKSGSHGSNNGFSKLNEEKVRRIKEIIKNKSKKLKNIAEEYQVDPTTISLIKRGITWKHVL